METMWAAIVYPPIYWFFVALDRWPRMQQYRIASKLSQPTGRSWRGGSVKGLLWQFSSYVFPLAFLDTFTRKHYAGVPWEEWASEAYVSW